MAKCMVCKEEKDALALKIVKDGNTYISKCFACETGFQELEDYFVKTQKDFFKSADKIWEKIGV